MQKTMTPARRKYEENQKLMSNYVESHPELKALVDAFMELQKARQDGRCAKLNISIGEKMDAVKSKEDGFLVYLKNRIENPKITFSSFGNGNGNDSRTPQIVITGDDIPVATFSVDYIRILSSDAANDSNSCPFDRHGFRFNYAGKFDYDMTMIVYR